MGTSQSAHSSPSRTEPRQALTRPAERGGHVQGGEGHGRGWQPATALARRWLAALWRDHRLITIAVAVSLVPRVLASLAVRPALFTPDSFGYLAGAVHLTLGPWHPLGYPVALLTLQAFHSLLLVTTLQHLMGITTALLGYSVLRHWDLPAWGAVLAACPTLFDSRQVALESFILPDTLYAFLIMSAVALLLTRRRPATLWCALAGLLLSGAAITRGNGAAEIAPVLAVLLIQRVGWRAVTAVTVAFAVPVLAYMGLFASRYGDFALTSSDGMFLWSRTMSFANCAVIKPPADLRPLCPDRQPHHPSAPAPAWSLSALLNARPPTNYLWAAGAWWRHDAQPGFNAANNARARRFALAAITAQPADYLRTVGSDVMVAFLARDRSLTFRTLHFTPAPEIAVLGHKQVAELRNYSHGTSNTRLVQPYAYFLYLYQEPVYFPGILFLLVVAAGLAGVIRNWRQRGGPGALPWAVAIVGIVVPIAVHQYHYRYMIAIVPAACLAAGLAFARRPAAPSSTSTVTSPTAPSRSSGGDTADARTPEASPSTWPAVTPTRTPSSPLATQPAPHQWPSTAPAAST